MTARILAFTLAVCSFAVPVSAHCEIPVWSSFGEADGVYSRVQTDEKVVALTFDDGPHPYLTPQILDILDEYEAKATFFVVGDMAKSYPSVLKEVSKRGHEIGNHTYTHLVENSNDCEKLKKEIIDTELTVLEIAHQQTRLFRPPTGYCCKKAVKMTQELGYKTIVWDIDTMDWAHNTPQKIAQNIQSNVKNGSIILFHDFIGKNSPTVEALKTVLPKLKAEGYRFVTVGDMIATKV